MKLFTSLLISLFSCRTLNAQVDVHPTAQSLHNFLQKNCASCHLGNGDKVTKFGDFSDRDVLLKYINQKNPQKSELYLKIKNGDMPKADYGDFLDPKTEIPAALELVEKWVLAGAPELVARAPVQKSKKEYEVDLALQAAKASRNPVQVRFFSFASLLNDPKLSSQVPIFMKALSKLVNSLSTSSRIVVPKKLDRQNTIVMIELDDYAWTSETWRQIEFRNFYRGEYLSQFDKFGELRNLTQSKHPIVRADWFVKEASQPPLYYTVLDFSNRIFDITQKLNFDLFRNIRDERVLRAGFVNSGVSQSNRVIERHSTRDGAFWLSYDFASSQGSQNIMINPLGPLGADRQFDDVAFRHDGGEIIFNLPNGYQAYLLGNANGVRLDKAPSNIVTDPNRPDRLVTNGLSCMGCHNRGIIEKTDDVAPIINAAAAKGSTRLSSAAVNKVNALYGNTSEISRKMKEDIKRFLTAQNQAQADLPNDEDAVNRAVRIYEAPLDVERVKLELDLNDQDLSKLAADRRDHRTLELIAQASRGIKRDLFERVFFRGNEDAQNTLSGRFQRVNPNDVQDPNRGRGQFRRRGAFQNPNAPADLSPAQNDPGSDAN